MEIMKRKQCIIILCIMIIMILTMLTGCQKKFWEYDCIWVSEDPYICILGKEYGYRTSVEIEGIMYELDTARSNDGTGITFYDLSIDEELCEESVVWDATCEIKKGELYLTIIKDNVSDYKGKTIVLHQQPIETEDN